MKKMRRLIPAIAMLLVSAVMLSTASFAWFTMSTEAHVSGMEVTATASSSLLIVNAKDVTLTTAHFLSANGIETLDGVEGGLYPATSVDGVMYKVEDAAAVDPSTGFYVDEDGEIIDTPLTDDGVSEENRYYYDYEVALGSAGGEITGVLKATVTFDESDYVLHKATSVDFLVDGEYFGTVHADGSNGFVATTDESVTIPMTLVDEEMVEGAYVIITMRVYFDGDLAGEDGKAYVRNAYAIDEPIGFKVDFKVGN